MPSPDVSSPAEADELGNRFLSEIREQPQALLGLLEHESEFARTAAAVRRRGTRLVRMVGHGSSDNAASYGVYTFGLLLAASETGSPSIRVWWLAARSCFGW